MRILKRTTLVVILVLTGLTVSSPAQAGERGTWFSTRAGIALDRVISADTGQGSAFQYGAALYASGRINGWQHSRTVALAARVLAERKAATPLTTQAGTTCNYGLDRAYDAFNDGSVNPITTTYAVTMAGHVGDSLRLAYKGGTPGVGRQDVQCIVDALTEFPTVPMGKGVCVAYSDQAADVAAGCVHNVNSGVAWFLSEANKDGFGATGMQRRITNIVLAEAVAYHPAQFAWPYIEGQTQPQDVDHGSYSSEAMMSLAFWLGREPTYVALTTTAPAGSSAAQIDQYAVAHLRLAGANFGASLPGTTVRNDPDVSLWCQLSDQHRAEMDALLSRRTGLDAAQWAQYGARAARSCATQES